MELLLRALARQHGNLLNAAEIGRCLGVSGKDLTRLLQQLVREGRLRLLPHLPKSILQAPGAPPPLSRWKYPRTGARRPCPPENRHFRVGRPRVYLRDPRQWMGPAWMGPGPGPDDLEERLFRGCLVHQIVQLHQREYPGAGVYWWGSGGGRTIDLIVETTGERIGFQFRQSPVPGGWDGNALRFAWERGLISRGFLLYPGIRGYQFRRKVTALPFAELLNRYPRWVGPLTPRELLEAVAEVNAGSVRRKGKIS